MLALDMPQLTYAAVNWRAEKDAYQWLEIRVVNALEWELTKSEPSH
jgi:hypothetical protein